LFSPLEILDMAIRLEKNGESVYRNAIKQVSKPDLVSLLAWMADEEVKHAEWFSQFKQNLETTSSNPFIDEMSRELFNDLLGEKSFSHKDVNFSKVSQLADLLAIFIEFEKDTVIFYETLKAFIDDKDTLENLAQIIAEENTHIKKLQEFLISESELAGVH
jgi:rubrerythrin